MELLFNSCEGHFWLTILSSLYTLIFPPYNIVLILNTQGKYEESLTAYHEICKKSSDMTPLHLQLLVTQKSLKELIKLLLTNGANILARNNSDTVLHQIVSSDDIEIIELILKKIKGKEDDIEPYINAPDTEGDTPFMWAAETAKINVAKYYRNMEQMLMLEIIMVKRLWIGLVKVIIKKLCSYYWVNNQILVLKTEMGKLQINCN